MHPLRAGHAAPAVGEGLAPPGRIKYRQKTPRANSYDATVRIRPTRISICPLPPGRRGRRPLQDRPDRSFTSGALRRSRPAPGSPSSPAPLPGIWRWRRRRTCWRGAPPARCGGSRTPASSFLLSHAIRLRYPAPGLPETPSRPDRSPAPDRARPAASWDRYPRGNRARGREQSL